MDYSIWVTSACNMKCKYCYVDEMKNEHSFSEDDVWDLMSFINSTYNSESIKINFFGGEPLLNFRLVQQIISEIEKHKEYDVSYYMTTNGLLLDNEKIQYIKNKKIKISLSWDGIKEANDFNRIDTNGKGTYERIKQAYQLLVGGDVSGVRVRGTFNSHTVRYLMESIENFYTIDNNMDVILVPDYFDSEWTEATLEELTNIVKTVYEDERYQNIMIIGDNGLRKGRCSGGEKSFHIYVNGKIYPCSFVVGKHQFEIGDIKSGIDREKVLELSSNYDTKLNTCEDCDYHDYCISNKCRYLNWSLTEDFNCASSLVCQFENIKMQ